MFTKTNAVAYFKEDKPPRIRVTDNRPVADVFSNPQFGIYDFNSLAFPNTQGPVVPGNGGYASLGTNMIEYGDQPRWRRGDTSDAGPVREFFRRMMKDTRIKHV